SSNKLVPLGKSKKMAKKNDEHFEAMEEEIQEIKNDLQKIPAMEESLSALVKNVKRLNVQGDKQHQQQQMLMKNLDQLNSQVKKQQQQHQLLMKYIEELVKEKSTTTSDSQGSSSKPKTKEHGRKK
ncbi:hypothetical protein Csa_017505, partial [Cucumis sativus]